MIRELQVGADMELHFATQHKHLKHGKETRKENQSTGGRW